MNQLFGDFHDAEVIAIEVDRQRSELRLHFALSNQTRKTITLVGVSHFRAVDLITQNVISRLIVSSSDGLTSDEIHHWVEWVTRLTDNSTFANDQQVLDLQRRISQGELTLFVLVPSWGAEIVAVARCYSVS